MKPQITGGLGPPGKKKKRKKGGKFWKNWNPMEPLRGKSAKREINARTRLEFDPLRRQLQRELGASNYRIGAEIPTWYQNYQNTLGQLQGQSGAVYDQASQQMGQASQQAAQQDTAARGQLADKLQKDAALRGGRVDPGVYQSSLGAQNARANLLTQMQGTMQGQKANQQGFMSNQRAIAGQAQREAMDREMMRYREIESDQRKLARDRGDYKSQLLGELREAERKYGLEKGALGIDKQKLKLDASKFRKGHRLDKRTQRERERANREKERQDRREEKGRNRRDKKGKGGKKGKKL